MVRGEERRGDEMRCGVVWCSLVLCDMHADGGETYRMGKPDRHLANGECRTNDRTDGWTSHAIVSVSRPR